MDAYTKEININTQDSHQTSAGVMITCLRWSIRDTYNYIENKNSNEFLQTREPMIVYSDIIQCNITQHKAALTPQLTVILKGGDINYSTALNPGDFLLINIVNYGDNKIHNLSDSSNGVSLYHKAKNCQPINNYDDGFKGVFKVQSCREQIRVDDKTGTKQVFYELQAFGFTEFNNAIYYDPEVFSQFTGKYGMFMSQFNNFWSDVVAGRNNYNIQDIIEILIKALIGTGTKAINNQFPQPNHHFRIPQKLGLLLGQPNAKYVSDIYNYVIGVWSNTSVSTQQALPPYKGFNLGITNNTGTFYKTKKKLDGRKIVDAQYWNNVKAYEIIKKYINDVINEMYSTFRVDINNKIMPTIVIRQKPFTTQHYKTNTPVSRHLEMPRWKISPNLILSMNLGKDEAARINFVQIYTRSLAANDANNRALQVGNKNWVADTGDITRSGLRPFLATANFDFPIGTNKTTKSSEWSNLVADWLFNGHLRSSGVIECVGIEEPICVGDNLELNGIVYHIESVTHSVVQMSNGFKTFRTKLTVSFGMDLRSNKDKPVYPEMQFTDYHTKALEDWNNERILPGWSEAQDIYARQQGNGEETELTKESDFTTGGTPKKKMFDGNNSGENDK